MTELSRRNLLKGGAALATLAVPATPAVGAPLAATVGELLPVAREHPWQWWCSDDKALYHDPFDTFEEALAYAKQCGFRNIAQCRQQDFDLSVDGSRLLELLCDDNDELIGEGEFISATREQELDLGRMVTDAIYRWAAKHKIDLTAWQFGDVRDETDVAAREAATPEAGAIHHG